MKTSADAVSVLLIFDNRNRILLSRSAENTIEPLYIGNQSTGVDAEIVERFKGVTGKAHLLVEGGDSGSNLRIFCMLQSDAQIEDGQYFSIDELETASVEGRLTLSPTLVQVLQAIEPELVRVPYLDFSETEYIYRFRTAKERNREIYVDQQS